MSELPAGTGAAVAEQLGPGPFDGRQDRRIAEALEALAAIPAERLAAAIADPTPLREVRHAYWQLAAAVRRIALLRGHLEALARLEQSIAAAGVDPAAAWRVAAHGLLVQSTPTVSNRKDGPGNPGGHEAGDA